MRLAVLGLIAAGIAGFSVSPLARAADTFMLGGVGSLSGSHDAIAPVITLKGDATTTADITNVARGGGFSGGRGGVGGFHGGFSGGRVAVGGFRGSAFRGGVGFRSFSRGWGWGRPSGGFVRPWGWGWGWNRPLGWGWNRPWGWGWNRTWVGGSPWGWGWGGGWGGDPSWGFAGGGFPSSSVVTFSSPSICDCSGGPSTAGFAPGVGIETAPPPVPNGGFRYDGGPTRPIPASPAPGIPRTPPVPGGPFVDTVARRTVKKLEYPAYGEAPGVVRTANNPLLVKNSRP
jgi:hypothetical protein